MNAPLSGLRVLVTRPDPQHQATCSAIADKGGLPFHFPLIKIEALTSDDAIQSIKSKIEHLDNYHALIFISNNAAHYGASWINDYWPQFPVGIEVIAVGPSTSRKISAELDCTVVHSEQGASSEDILELDQLKEVAGKRIAIFRGIGGREMLAETLLARGAEVVYIEVYQRMAADNSSAELATMLLDESINVLSVTSSESLQRLLELINSSSLPADYIKETPLIVPSSRVAEIAEQLGFMTVKIAKGADVEATINALQELAN